VKINHEAREGHEEFAREIRATFCHTMATYQFRASLYGCEHWNLPYESPKGQHRGEEPVAPGANRPAPVSLSRSATPHFATHVMKTVADRLRHMNAVTAVR
jgi:hypothetical protein